MARLPYLNREDLPEHDREIFDNIMQRHGRILNYHRVMAHSPALLRAGIQMGETQHHSTRLDPIWRELAIITVGRLTECDYEFVHHQGIAKRVGVRPEQLEQLERWEQNPVFSEQEQAVIRYASEATQHVKVSDTTFDALRNFLDAEQIVELATIVAHYNRAARILVPLEVELESDAHESRYNLDRAEQKSS